MIMTMDILEGEIAAMIHAFMLTGKKIELIKGVSMQFLIEQFGVLICGINRPDYRTVADAVSREYPDWRSIYITTFDDINEMRYEVLWELMKSGYIIWLRTEYPRLFTRSITEGLGDRIINKRLEMWNDKAKFVYLKSLNEWAKTMPKTYILSTYPGFFDNMIWE